MSKSNAMELLAVTVKSDEAAQSLKAFLQTIDYIETVNQVSDESNQSLISFTKGNYTSSEKPSDFAGIWKNRKKIDAKKLRERLWNRKNQYPCLPHP